ncbi:mechanosensitive ion channel domain-containing protein [Verrucomicrobiales bacterium BCK34]|nr:mechanosensitive ion channel domain-containing protein [Verrucomicrobiales bacterium BCK34]
MDRLTRCRNEGCMTLGNFDLSQLDLEKIFVTYAIPWGTKVVLAILVYLIGSLVAKWLLRLIKKGLGRSRLDGMLVNFVSNILRWVFTLLVIIVALEQLGIPTTSLITLLGAAGLAVGLALKDSLQNFASGVLLILFRPFRTGDFIEAGGKEGVVEEIRIFSTQLRTPDNREITLPNGEVYSNAIINYTAKEQRRIDLVIGIGYDDDLRKAKQVLEGILADEERVLKEPAPLVAVGELGASSVDILVRPWTTTPDYFATKCAITEKIKLALDEAGISIPYPQMDVHLDGGGEA